MDSKVSSLQDRKGLGVDRDRWEDGSIEQQRNEG